MSNDAASAGALLQRAGREQRPLAGVGFAGQPVDATCSSPRRSSTTVPTASTEGSRSWTY